MKLFVTGATGFVGGRTLQRLLAAGHDIAAAFHRRPPLALPGVEWVAVDDLHRAQGLRERLSGCEAVVHLAALSHLPRAHSGRTAANFAQVNVGGTVRIAEAAAEAGVRRFVFLSSVKACGEISGSRPLRESDPKHPRDSYGESKSQAEDRLAEIAASTSMETVVIRPPLVYGPGVRANFLSLVRWIDSGMPLPLAGIDNRRSLIYVGNLADAIASCLERLQAAGRTYFVSDGEDVSTPDLARRIARALGRPARLVNVSPSLLRIAAWLPGLGKAIERLTGSLQVDSSLIRDELAWRPPFSLDEGLAATARWYLAGHSAGTPPNV